MEDNTKKSKLTILIERNTHIACFLYPVLFAVIALYYTISTREINPIFILISISFFAFQYYSMYYGKKIIVTDQKIYIYVKNKKIVSWKLLGDFAYIDYQQNKLGKLFNYGTLRIANTQNLVFNYHFLNDGTNVYNKILEQHVILAKKLDPSYELGYKEETKQLDTLEESENGKSE